MWFQFPAFSPPSTTQSIPLPFTQLRPMTSVDIQGSSESYSYLSIQTSFEHSVSLLLLRQNA